MDEYIKRSDALNASKIVYIECIYLDEEEYEEGESDDIPVVFRRDIEAIPAADVAPVRRGKWKRELWFNTCSECGFTMTDKDDEGEPIAMNFCPNCGADMREDG